MTILLSMKTHLSLHCCKAKAEHLLGLHVLSADSPDSHLEIIASRGDSVQTGVDLPEDDDAGTLDGSWPVIRIVDRLIVGRRPVDHLANLIAELALPTLIERPGKRSRLFPTEQILHSQRDRQQ